MVSSPTTKIHISTELCIWFVQSEYLQQQTYIDTSQKSHVIQFRFKLWFKKIETSIHNNLHIRNCRNTALCMDHIISLIEDIIRGFAYAQSLFVTLTKSAYQNEKNKYFSANIT